MSQNPYLRGSMSFPNPPIDICQTCDLSLLSSLALSCFYQVLMLLTGLPLAIMPAAPLTRFSKFGCASLCLHGLLLLACLKTLLKSTIWEAVEACYTCSYSVFWLRRLVHYIIFFQSIKCFYSIFFLNN